MKQKLGKMTHISGNNFRDERGRMIIVDHKNQIGYVVPKDKEMQVSILQSGLFIVMLVAIITGFYYSWIFGIILAGAIYGVIQYYYKKKFLESLVTVESNDFPDKRTVKDTFVESGRTMTIARLVSLLVLPVLMVINCVATLKNVETYTVDNYLLIVFSAIIAIVSLYLAYICLQALQTIGKENK